MTVDATLCIPFLRHFPWYDGMVRRNNVLLIGGRGPMRPLDTAAVLGSLSGPGRTVLLPLPVAAGRVVRDPVRSNTRPFRDLGLGLKLRHQCLAGM